MKQLDPISTIMTESVITVNLSNTLEEAAKLFKKNHIRHIPVTSGNKLVGMLSLTDMKRLSFFEAYVTADEEGEEEMAAPIYEMLSIEQVMANNVETINPYQSIKEVAQIFATHEFHALPVISNGELMGIVTTTDMIKFLLRNC
ncbi:MAG: CBS domain-containing protein [Bacteroidia bacterium]